MKKIFDMKPTHEMAIHSLDRIGNIHIILAIRNGLIMSIPVLMFGSFSLILQNLPINAYQRFIMSFMDGIISNTFSFITTATFGMLSVYMTAFISIGYIRTKPMDTLFPYGACITALICFTILVGTGAESFSMQYFGVRGMFTAIFSASVASALYTRLNKWLTIRKYRLRADGADLEFNNAVSIILPSIIIIFIFSMFRILITYLFGVSGLHELFVLAATRLFIQIDSHFWRGVLFVLLSSIMWFFGIHGSDVLEGVSETLLVPAEAVSGQIISETQIVTKGFIDTFVLMGGCGTAITLLIAIILFSKRRANRSLAKMSLLPMLFNINEIMIFGLPVVFNPYLLLPFICVPLSSFLLSYSAMRLGFVPAVSMQVHWTTPILLGGYKAVGAFSGAVLQFCCTAVGVLIYSPFIKIYDDILLRRSVRCVQELTEILKKSENNGLPVMLTELHDEHGSVAKLLAADLKDDIENGAYKMYYQPQYNYEGVCEGAEALLRWNHYQAGMIYPPLVIKLADEIGLLETLEKQIVQRVADDLKDVCLALGDNIKISVNVSGKTVQSETYIEFIKQLIDNGSVRKGDILLEITEQTAFLSENSDTAFSRIKEIGYPMAIDDFSMGHTSLKYLQMNSFDMVKLDGSLVKEVVDNKRVREIIGSIIYLSKTLNFKVLAEYVETKEQEEALAQIGCTIYQGYLFSPARSLEQLADKSKV